TNGKKIEVGSKHKEEMLLLFFLRGGTASPRRLQKTAISHSFFNDFSYICPVFILHFSYISHDDCIDDGC
ncbi:hypothetical protein ABHZ94_24300, partial [Bacteroides ovatus]